MKWDQFKYIFDESQPDIIGISEHNRVITRMTRANRPQEILSTWQPRTISRFAWLRSKSNLTSYETGGTGIITTGKGSTHTIASGEDEHGLGRWNWITLKGKYNKTTTIITVYRPGKNQIALDKQQAHTSRTRPGVAKRIGPQELWDKELVKLILSFKEKNHEVIVGGDWNDNLNDKRGQVQTKLTDIGLREVLITRYGPGPETFQSGSTTIDGIFTSRGITIKQGGYTSHEASPGDHRWLWIDVSETTMLDNNRDDYAPPLERRATAKIPSVRHKFNDILEQQISYHNLHHKLIDLYQQAEETGTLTEPQERLYDMIEERMKRGVKCADSNCRKIRRGQIPFSPKAQEIMRKLRILRLVYMRHRMKGTKRRPKMRKLQRLAKKYNYTGPLTYDTDAGITKALAAAKQEYSEFKPRAFELRERYLHLLAQEYADEDIQGRNLEWHTSNLIRQEKVKMHFRHIKRFEGKLNKKGVDKVDVEQEDGRMHTVFDKEEVSEHICRANIEKRQQARNTPLRKEPLQTLLGEQMEFDKWEQVLNSNIDLPRDGIEEGTRLWYDMISAPPQEQFDITWTTKEYCDSWKKMEETKSSIPGIHTVHMKCLTPESAAAEIFSKLALIPLMTGYAPTAWKKGIDSMIPKKIAGECRPDKLRLILLFDARFNHNNKLIGKKMMEYAEERGILAKEQFGSRKHKSAIEHAVNKRLTLDISRQLKSTCTYIANDAKSCYDRILLMVAYFAMRNAGVTSKTALSSIKTLVEMSIHVKTAHGISQVNYGGDKWTTWPHGIGQGNGYGPAIWALISSPLLKIMRYNGFGTSLQSPLTNERLTMAGFSFVDDTDQCEMGMINKPWGQQLRDTQRSLTLWEALIRTTGGALEPSKSDWTKLKYTWNRGTASLEAANPNDKLYMKNPDGIVLELKQKDPKEARETLGVWQSPTGSEKIQMEKLKEKIASWGTCINRSGIDRKETATAVKITIGKTIRYPLGATTLSVKESKSINKTFRWAALGKMKIVRTASAMMTSGPIEYGGLGMNNDIYENQLIDHTLVMLNHGHTKSTTGILLRTSLESLAIEAGIGGDPGSFDIKKIPWITKNTWIGSTLTSYKTYGLELETSLSGLALWNSRDAYIMEQAFDIAGGQDLLVFNKVRLFLRVATVSDLCTADGRAVDPSILQGKRSTSPSFSETAYSWPNVPPPTRQETKIWTQLISEMLAISPNYRRLASESSFKWDSRGLRHSKWTVGTRGKYVYQHQRNHWRRWKVQKDGTSRRHSITYVFQKTVQQTESQVHPVSIRYVSEGAIMVTHKGKVAMFENDVITTTGWILPQVVHTQEDSEVHFAQQLMQNKGILVSDGSYKDNRSSAALTNVPNKDIQVSLSIPGRANDQSSYRAELGGILAAIVYTNRIAEKFDIQQGGCTMICDNKGALSASFTTRRINPRWQCYDILCLIHFHLANSVITWTHKHVKGHQDDNTSYDDLDIISQANVDVDLLAKEEWQMNRVIRDDEVLPGQCWRLKDGSNSTYINGNVEASLRQVICENAMKSYWAKKFHINRDITHAEWKLWKKVQKSHNEWEHTYAFKLASGILPTKENMVLRQHDDDVACPCCVQKETSEHIIRCQSDIQTTSFATEVSSFEKYLTNVTSWEIRGALIELLYSFRNQHDPKIHHNWSDNIADVVNAQFNMGQQAFFSGLWHEHWIQAQSDFHTTLTTRKHGMTVIVNMIKQLQTLHREMWYSRNDALHQNTSSRINRAKIVETDNMIDSLFQRKRLIPLRMLAMADRKYFRRNITVLKRMRLVRKERWVRDAEAILDKYDTEQESEQVRRFRTYFMHRDDG